MLATYAPAYVNDLIRHAIYERNGAGGKHTEDKTIQISDSWMEALHAVPFVSQHRGSTIHLLKAGSAKTPKQRQRKSIGLHMTPQEYVHTQEESKTPDFHEPNEDTNYEDITSKLKRSKRGRSKERDVI